MENASSLTGSKLKEKVKTFWNKFYSDKKFDIEKI